MKIFEKNCQVFLWVVLLAFFLIVPNFITKAAVIDETSTREIIYCNSISINKRFSTPSFVSLKLGDNLNLVSAEYLLGDAVDSSGPIYQGNLRIEQITFEHGIIVTHQFKIWSIRFIGGKIPYTIKPLIDSGGIGLDTDESYIRKVFGDPQKVDTSFPKIKILVYTNGYNYAQFDIDESTDQVRAFEIGLL